MHLLIGLGVIFAQGYYLARSYQSFIGKRDLHEVPTCLAYSERHHRIIIGGYAFSSKNSLSDGWLSCITPTGEVEWHITPGGMGPDRIEDVVVRDSIVFFCGYSGSMLSHPEELPVERRADFWVGAVDERTGQLLWQRRWGSPHIDMALTLALTPYRTILVGGLTWSDTIMGMQAVIYVLNDRTGEILHTLHWGHSPSLIRQIRPMGDGRSFVCIGEQELRPFLAEVDYLGQVYWRTVFQFHRFPSQLQAVAVLSDGRIIIGGKYEHRWGVSAFTSKGQIIWERLWPEDGLVGSPSAIVEGHDGTIYVLGTQQGEVLFSSEQKGGEDVWLAALSKNGNILWERGFGGPYDEQGVALLALRDTIVALSAKENRFSDAPFHRDAWFMVFKAVPCDSVMIQIRTDVPSLKEKAGRPIRFWIDLPPVFVPDGIDWDFGDEGTAQGKLVEHIYASPGNYSVQVRIRLKYGCPEIYPPPIGLRITRP
ncbi:MAG: PKD domain-containing protein [Bacteroidia bacterium]|nr:PKD domain-containing protein [Bacteroidia bacterium]MCX7651822.1 PKD domain-containing protein [Bacteroidia bacterium]MDW8417076.1 PKD domain-containing protein [Bacteroidia bacterium]